LFQTQILDVAIGLFFVYLLLSLLVTAANELLASITKRRAAFLWKGVKRMVGPEVAASMYNDPLICSLTFPGGWANRNRPSYIPSRAFAVTLLRNLNDNAASGVSLSDIQARLAAPAGKLSPGLARLLTTLLDETRERLASARNGAPADSIKASADEGEAFKQSIEMWFNSAMERVSGWYKRRTQAVLLVVALLVTITMNADTLQFVKVLWSDPAIRAAMVAQAQRGSREVAGLVPQTTAEQGPPPPPTRLPDDNDPQNLAEARFNGAMDQIEALPLPMGWSVRADDASNAAFTMWPGFENDERTRSLWWATLRFHMAGWLLTALAISLGAPFWFDILNKVISIRSAGKAPEERQKDPKQVPGAREPGLRDVSTKGTERPADARPDDRRV
jgi:hypothetical protein